MKSVFVVVGKWRDEDSGDDESWMVAAYPEKDSALLHAAVSREQLAKWFEENDDPDNAFAEGAMEFFSFDRVIEPHHLLDEVTYSVEEVPFSLHPDDYLERTP